MNIPESTRPHLEKLCKRQQAQQVINEKHHTMITAATPTRSKTKPARHDGEGQSVSELPAATIGSMEENSRLNSKKTVQNAK
jgi:hypothetical protein